MIGSGTPAGAAAPSIRAFVAFGWVWLAYALLVAAFPGSPMAGSPGRAIAIDVAFLAIVLLAARLTLRAVPPSACASATADLRPGQVGRVAWLGLGLGALGAACLLYDRVAVQGIDFGSGLAVAREQWGRAAGSRTGASSAFSVLGYGLVGCSMAGACAALREVDGRPTATQAALLGGCVAVVLAVDTINGGRSSLLLLPALCMASWVLNPRLSVRHALLRPWAAAILAITIAYSLFVFDSRISKSEMDARSYSMTMLEYLRIEPSAWLRSAALPHAGWLAVLAWSYLAHSFAITCEIAVRPMSDQMVLGHHALSILSKLGLGARADAGWFLSGRFPGLPGALYHQAGITGVAVGATVLGSASGLAFRAASRSPGSIAALGGVAGCVAVLLLSPLLAAFDLLAFPSAMLGFVVLALVERCLPAPNR
jgi:hypothetical protein